MRGAYEARADELRIIPARGEPIVLRGSDGEARRIGQIGVFNSAPAGEPVHEVLPTTLVVRDSA